MTSIVSLISGQFTRSLIFGAFFPVVLFIALGTLSVGPLLPNDWRVVAAFGRASWENRIIALTFAAIVLTVFLYFLNIPLVRMLEGYPWKESKRGKKRVEDYKGILRSFETLLPRLRFLRSQWQRVDGTSPNVAKIQQQMNVINRTLNSEYPAKDSLVLPTRFGNVLRSFETYSLEQYGIDAIPFWPRIISVADKDTLTAVEDARSPVDFFVNSLALSAVLATMLFAAGCFTLNAETPPRTFVILPIEIAAAIGSAFWFYFGAIAKVRDWGAQVRSVFDLFRFDLLKKMGYQQLPDNRQDERALWNSITKQVLFGDSATEPLLPYKPAAMKRTSVETMPEVATILTAGVRRQWDTAWRYAYRVRNQDLHRAATLKVTERLPDGWMYVWDSATRNPQGTLAVTGENPYTFDVGQVAANSEVEISFSVVKIEQNKE